MSESRPSIVAMFDAALQLPPAQRAAYLDQACADDAGLRHQVETLLESHDSAGGFMKDPGVHPPSSAPTSAKAMEDESEDSPDDMAVGQSIGRYKLLEKVGEGGCGVVYVAEQTEPVRRRVALKVIKLGMDTKAVVARFEAERQALAMMDHANIAKVLEAGRSEKGRPFFVMELVRGIPITQYCDQANLSTQARLELFIKVCQAIQHAHQKGIIHRDIKPSNILVTMHDGVPVPKVIDFGIAKAIEGRLTEHTVYTQLHQFIGTPAYMSPEQAELTGLDIDTRSDIYSLGVLLYELLSGTTPFDPKELLSLGLDAMRKIIREQEPPRPSTRLGTLAGPDSTSAAKCRSTEPAKLTHQLRGDLDWIVMKCLEKDRTRRYETANGLAADLKRHLADEPVGARPPSASYRLQKAFRRNKLVCASGAVVFFALLAGLGSATVMFNREQKTNLQLQSQMDETKKAKRSADETARTAQEQRRRAEVSVQLMQIQKAEELFGVQQAASAVAYLGRVLRANPSNEVAAARLASAMLRPFPKLLIEPLRHGGGVWCAEFSPDGSRVVTGSLDWTARVWDARTGEALSGPLHHESVVSAVQFSPDGLRVLTASEDRTARVWDARTGQPLTEPLRHEGPVRSARFSADGLRVVTTSKNGVVRQWDPRTGKPATGPLPVESMGSPAEFSADGLRRVTRSYYDDTACVWRESTQQPLTEPLPHPGVVNSAQFNPDGLRLVTTCEDGSARIWDIHTSPPVTEPLQHRAEVCCARFSPDGLRVVTASPDHTARVWDARSGEPLTPPLRHEAPVRDAEFSPDGRCVVTAANDGTARVWNARTGEQLTKPLLHEREVISARFSHDGLRVITGCEDMTARIWEARTGQRLTEPLPVGGAVYAVEFSRDGDCVVTAAAGSSARVWDARTGQALTPALMHKGFVVGAQFSPDGRRVLTASHDFTARVWNAQTGQPLTDPLLHRQRVESAQFSPDGSRVVTASADHTARVWDSHTGQPLTEPLRHQAPVFFAAFSPDGLRVVSASEDGTARVWDARTGQPVTDPLRHEGPVRSATFSPDGLWVLTASADGTARVWEVPPAGLTVPAWFLDWAEARVGRRFDEQDTTAEIPFAEQRRRREQIQSRTDTSYFTRLAQWVEADPSARAISPNAALTMWEHVRRLIATNTVSSLREALLISPAESLAWGRLALHLAKDARVQANEEAGLAQAEGAARRALKLDRRQTDAWLAVGMVQRLRHQPVEAQASLDRALAVVPENAEGWETRGDLLGSERRLAEAVEAYSQALALLPGTNGASLLAKRAEAYLGVKRWDLAKNDWTRAVQQQPDLAETAFRRLSEAQRWKDAVEFGLPWIKQKPDDALVWLGVAPVLVLAGDQAANAECCARMRQQFAESKDPETAERVIKVCLLLPNLIDPAKLPGESLAQELTSGTGPVWAQWGWTTRALLAYRSGDAESAVKYVTKSGETTPNDLCTPTSLAIRAMARHQLGRSEEARRDLEGASQIITRLEAEEAKKGDRDLLIAQILFREADALINGKAKQ